QIPWISRLHTPVHITPVMYIDNNGRNPARVIATSSKGNGLVYTTDRNRFPNTPEWIDLYMFYGEITPMVNLSLTKVEIGIAKVEFRINISDNDNILNPSLFFDIGAMTADGNIGFGVSGKLSVISGSCGIQFGDGIKISGTLYVGVGFSFDFSNGLKVGAPGWEVSAEFSWIEIFN
ncbi:MAG: hypothetical protein WCX25_06115, partial [Candidatus Izemoplasmatales bacterium]